MAANQTKTTFGFRIVIRGTNAKNKRVRRVLTVQAKSYDDVNLEQCVTKNKMLDGLKNVRYNILPPAVV